MSATRSHAARPPRRRQRRGDEPAPGAPGAARELLQGPRHETVAGERQGAALALQRSLGNRLARRSLGAVQRDSGPETPQDEARQAHEAGAAHYTAGAYEEAVAEWRRAYALPQIDARARGRIASNLGRALQRLGRGDEAVAMFQEALLAPGADRAELIELIRQARTGVDVPPAGGSLPAPTAAEVAAADAQAEAEIAAGDAAGRGGDFEAALAHFDAAYALRAASPRRHRTAIARRGHALRELGRADEAIDAFQEALGDPATTDDERLTLLAEIRRLRTGEADADVAPLGEDEQRQIFQEGEQAMGEGRYADALAKFEQIYGQPDARPAVRRAMTYNMAFCHQRMQDFEAAIPLYEESLLFPGIAEHQRRETLERVRQCREGEVGPGVTMDGATVSGDETVLFQGQVFFATGRSDLDGLGADTVQTLANLLKERHAGEPGLTFRVAVVGGASSRWRGAADPDAADRLNLALSERRAGNVETALVAELPPADLAAGVYTMDTGAQGDDLAEALGLDPDDNTWRLRSVLVTVWARGGAPAGGAASQP